MAANKMAHEELKYAEFLALMYRSDCKEVINAEHQRVISEKVEGTFTAQKENRSLNRFLHNVCFDHSRVILPKERNRGNYINANYIDGFEHTKKFICGEAPTRNTCYDFYRMLWMEQVQIIVMLTQKKENGKEKCYPYWSDVEQTSFRLGKFQITTTNVEKFPHYVKSTLVLTDGTEATQTVIHFNFTAWPDHECPKIRQSLLASSWRSDNARRNSMKTRSRTAINSPSRGQLLCTVTPGSEGLPAIAWSTSAFRSLIRLKAFLFRL